MTRKFALVAGLIVLVAGAILGTVQFERFQSQMRAITSVDHQAVSRMIANDLWDLAEKALAHRDRHSKLEHL